MSYDLWSRLRYMLSPQFDIYEQVSKIVYGHVIDIGSGTGFGTHLLTRGAGYVCGYEIDEVALEFSKKCFGTGDVGFLHRDITKDTKQIAKCDFVTMIDVIEHIEKDSLAIQNCKELLLTGGTFICSTPNRLSRYRKSEYHVREYSPGELKKLLCSVFKNVKLVDFKLQPLESDYSNPIIAICS